MNAIQYEQLGGVFQYECMSLCQLELGNFADAQTAMLKVVSTGLEYVGIRPMLDIIPHFSFVLYNQKKYSLAVELLGLVDNHEGGAKQWMAKWEKLIQLRVELQVQLAETTYQIAYEQGAQRDLEATVDELRVYLSDDNQEDTLKSKPQPLAEPLTNRELEVLSLIAEGLTNPQIAEKLYLSTGTVKVHTRNIYGKLSVSNRTEAVVVAQGLNLI